MQEVDEARHDGVPGSCQSQSRPSHLSRQPLQALSCSAAKDAVGLQDERGPNVSRQAKNPLGDCPVWLIDSAGLARCVLPPLLLLLLLQGPATGCSLCSSLPSSCAMRGTNRGSGPHFFHFFFLVSFDFLAGFSRCPLLAVRHAAWFLSGGACRCVDAAQFELTVPRSVLVHASLQLNKKTARNPN